MTKPELPEWLRAAEIQFNNGEKDHLPFNITKLLSLHKRIEINSNAETAEDLANLYEVGNLPNGSYLFTAIEWHTYAASVGSIHSALRAAQLMLWTASGITDDDSKAIAMAKMSIRNFIKRRFQGLEDIQSAISAAMLLFELHTDDETIDLIAELLILKKISKHPDFDILHKKLRISQCRKGKSALSLRVIHGRIAEDSDFKAGIYRTLEHPIPLSGLPDSDHVIQTLNREFPWFYNANQIIYRQLVIQQYCNIPAFQLRPLLLAGAPGVGKTTWAKRVAELCAVPFRVIMAAGSTDSMYLRGTPRGWSTSRPGGVIQTIAAECNANPLFLVDELDKTSDDPRNGRMTDVMLQLLEPASAKSYLDECLQVACDLSYVSWIATANEISKLPKPLLDRFTIVVISAPGSEHFYALVQNVVKNISKEMAIDERMLPTLNLDDLDILKKCSNPREISRTIRLMFEKKLVEERHNERRN